MNHVPVLITESLDYLSLKSGETVIDGTLGLGGHAQHFLKQVLPEGNLIAFDQDKRNLEEAKRRFEKSFTKNELERVKFFHDNFRFLKTRVTQQIDAIFLDLGLSSPHVDEAERGFSFSKDGPLDMRFDQRNSRDAAYVLNNYSEQDLADIFFYYAEHRASRKLARQIVERRKTKSFQTTTDLADFLASVLPTKKRSSRASKSHPATKFFQALRIEVNEELDALRDVLTQAFDLLKVGGRLVVISYHSLEDRIVKQFFKALQRPPAVSEEDKLFRNYLDPKVEILTKKPVKPSNEEIENNPRSRSALLRAIKKINL
jgi:16S rRNA (cytosine1402-N4)-methyltransferase